MSEPIIRKQPVHFKACSIGDKIKVYISHEYGESEHSFGQVINLDERQRPILFYTNYSDLKLHQFARALLFKDIVFSGDFVTHVAWIKPKLIPPEFIEELTEEEKIEEEEIRTFNGLRL